MVKWMIWPLWPAILCQKRIPLACHTCCTHETRQNNWIIWWKIICQPGWSLPEWWNGYIMLLYHDIYSLQWCHNEHDGVSNHWHLDCLLNCLFRCRSKKTSKLPVTGLWWCHHVIEAQWGHMASWNLFNIGSGNCLVTDGTKPFPEPMLAYCQYDKECISIIKPYYKFKIFLSRKCIWKSHLQMSIILFRSQCIPLVTYRKTSNISRTLIGNIIIDNSDIVGASPVGTAPTTSSFST